MVKYYEAVVDVIVGQTSTMKDKIQKERYLVDAHSVTEAEARVVTEMNSASNQLDYKISSVKESKIYKVINA